MFRSIIVALMLAARHGWCREDSEQTFLPTGSRQTGQCIKTIELKELKSLFAASRDYLDQNGKLAILITGCSVLAAPAILFYLKRRGFSRCKAWKEPEGLAISATR